MFTDFPRIKCVTFCENQQEKMQMCKEIWLLCHSVGVSSNVLPFNGCSPRDSMELARSCKRTRRLVHPWLPLSKQTASLAIGKHIYKSAVFLLLWQVGCNLWLRIQWIILGVGGSDLILWFMTAKPIECTLLATRWTVFSMCFHW